MSGETILLVDDEQHIIELAQMYLAKEGFAVLSAGDGVGVGGGVGHLFVPFVRVLARSVSLTDSTMPTIAHRAEKSRGVFGFRRESFFDFGVALSGAMWYNRVDP